MLHVYYTILCRIMSMNVNWRINKHYINKLTLIFPVSTTSLYPPGERIKYWINAFWVCYIFHIPVVANSTWPHFNGWPRAKATPPKLSTKITFWRYSFRDVTHWDVDSVGFQMEPWNLNIFIKLPMWFWCIATKFAGTTDLEL